MSLLVVVYDILRRQHLYVSRRAGNLFCYDQTAMLSSSWYRDIRRNWFCHSFQIACNVYPRGNQYSSQADLRIHPGLYRWPP